MTEKVQLDRASLIEALGHLEVIVPSLDRIGSLMAELPIDEQHRVLSEFIIDWSVTRRLARVRRLLSEVLDYDDLEQLFGDVEVWSSDCRKPRSG